MAVQPTSIPNPLISSRNYRLYWLAQVVNMLGDSFTGMARMWILMEMTNSTLSQGINMMIMTLPTLVLAPFVASWVDRLRRKPVLVCSDLLRMLLDLALVAVVATSSIRTWHLYLFSLGQALVRVLYLPCQHSFIPLLVSRDQLMKANGAQQLAMNIAMVGGPLLAGRALAHFGPVAVILVMPSLLVSALLTLAIRIQEKPAAKRQASNRQQLTAGWGYVKENPWIIYLTGSFMLVNMTGAITGMIVPFMIKNQFGLAADAVGLHSSFRSGGALVGSLLVSTLVLRGKRQKLLVICTATMAMVTATIGFTWNLASLLVVGLLAGVSGPFLATISNSTYHETVPDEFQGRVSLFRNTLATCMQPVTFLAVGVMGDRVPYSVSLLVAAALLGLASLIIATRVRLPEENQLPIAA